MCIPAACLRVRAMTHGGSDKVVTSFLWSGLQTWQSGVLDSEANTHSALMVSIFDFDTHPFRKTPLGERFLSSATSTLLLPVTISCFFVAYSFLVLTSKTLRMQNFTLKPEACGEKLASNLDDKCVFHDAKNKNKIYKRVWGFVSNLWCSSACGKNIR